MSLSLRFAAQQCGGRTSLVGTGGLAYSRRRRAAVVAVLCTTAAVVALMPALPARLAVATAYQTTGLSGVDAASGVIAAAGQRGRVQHRGRPARDVHPHRPKRPAVGNGPTVWQGRPSLSSAGDDSARSLTRAPGGTARTRTELPRHWLALLLAAAATAVVALRRPRCLWSLAAMSAASDGERAGLGLDRGSAQRTKSGRAPAALVAQVQQLQRGARDRWLDDLTGQMLSQLQDNGDRELDEEMCAAARRLEAVIGIGPDELQVLHRNASDCGFVPWFHFRSRISRHLDSRISDAISEFCGSLGSPSDVWYRNDVWALARKRLLAWNRVRCERDLFLPGLEEFDAKQVYHDELLARRQCLDAVARRVEGLLFDVPSTVCVRLWAAARWHLVGWVCSPAELQAHAYFPALRGDRAQLLKVAEILEQPEDSVVRMHVLQNRDWWNDLDHVHALDQLDDILGYSLTRLRGIGDRLAGRLAQAGVADLRALARLDEEQQQALVPKLEGISTKRLRGFMERAQQLVEEMPPRWPPPTLYSLTRVRGIGDRLAGRFAQAGVADLRALARLDEGQQQALLPKLSAVSDGMLQGFVTQAQVFVEMPPLALDAEAGLQSSALLNRQREVIDPDVRLDDNVVGGSTAPSSLELQVKLNAFVPEIEQRAHRPATGTASPTARDVVVECVAQLRDGERDRSLRLVAERFRTRVQKILSRGDDARDLTGSLGEGMHAAARNLQAVTGINLGLLNALYHSGSSIDHEALNLYPLSSLFIFTPLLHRCVFPSSFEAVVNDWNLNLDQRTGLALVRHRLLAWVRIKRGRDLFIRGLGGFDIKQVLDQTLLIRRSVTEQFARRAEECLEEDEVYTRDVLQLSAFVRWHPAGWLPSPEEVQACGHFDALRDSPTKFQSVVNILSLPEDNAVRAHLIRYRSWWNDLQHANALDELEVLCPVGQLTVLDVGDLACRRLAGAGVFDLWTLAQLDEQQQLALVPELEGMDQATLQGLVERAKRHVETLPLWPQGSEGLHPMRLLKQLRRAQEGPNIRFEFLEDLIDGAVDADGQQLRVLRDYDSVRDVADRLNNCAAMYRPKCASGRFILVALFDACGRPQALGGYQRNVRWWSIYQVVGHNNEDPASNVRQKFEDYEAVLQRWEDQRGPADPRTAPVPV